MQALVQQTGSPTLTTNQSTVQSNITASLAGTVYDQATPDQTIGSDFDLHAVSVPVTRLVPNALYHARLVGRLQGRAVLRHLQFAHGQQASAAAVSKKVL